jgi:hypothetical protein
VQAQEAVLVDDVIQPGPRLVDHHAGDVVAELGRDRHQGAVGGAAVDALVVARLVGADEQLAGAGAERHVVLLGLALADDRRQRLGGDGVAVDLLVGVAQGLRQQPLVAGAGGAAIGDPPQARRVEHPRARAGGDVEAIDRVAAGVDVVGGVVERAAIVGDVLQRGLDLGLMQDHAQRAAVGVLQVQPGVLLAADVAGHHQEAVVGRQADHGGAIFAAGELDREGQRSVLAPHLGGAGDRRGRVHALAVAGQIPGAGGAHVQHGLDAPGHLGRQGRCREPRDDLGRDAVGAQAGVAGRGRGRGVSRRWRWRCIVVGRRRGRGHRRTGGRGRRRRASARGERGDPGEAEADHGPRLAQRGRGPRGARARDRRCRGRRRAPHTSQRGAVSSRSRPGSSGR